MPDGDLTVWLEPVETTCELDDEPVTVPVGFSGELDGCEVETTRTACTAVVEAVCDLGGGTVQRWRFDLIQGPDGVEGTAEVESSAVAGECEGLYAIGISAR